MGDHERSAEEEEEEEIVPLSLEFIFSTRLCTFCDERAIGAIEQTRALSLCSDLYWRRLMLRPPVLSPAPLFSSALRSL